MVFHWQMMCEYKSYAQSRYPKMIQFKLFWVKVKRV